MARRNPLARWLRERGESQLSFAGRCGVASGVVSRWCSGARIPDRRCAILIEYHTKGDVPVEAWGKPAKHRPRAA